MHIGKRKPEYCFLSQSLDESSAVFKVTNNGYVLAIRPSIYDVIN